jgi:hypothetical protein
MKDKKTKKVFKFNSAMETEARQQDDNIENSSLKLNQQTLKTFEEYFGMKKNEEQQQIQHADENDANSWDSADDTNTDIKSINKKKVTATVVKNDEFGKRRIGQCKSIDVERLNIEETCKKSSTGLQLFSLSGLGGTKYNIINNYTT